MEENERLAIMKRTNEEIEQFTGGTTDYLPWIPEHAFPLAGIIHRCGEEIERLGRVLPMPAFEELAALYARLHRYAYTLWNNRGEVEFLLRPVLPRKM